jgi:hypothetical protein
MFRYYISEVYYGSEAVLFLLGYRAPAQLASNVLAYSLNEHW